MLLILAGEGPTDFGTSDAAGQFAPGAMALIVDRIVQHQLDFSPIDCERVFLASKSVLSVVARSGKLRPQIALPGQKVRSEYIIYSKQAAALSVYARTVESEEGDCAVAVLFRDCDGTNSSPRRNWEYTVEAIDAGFQSMEFDRGVAMVPKPKQEAWLLCAIKERSYEDCALLELESGNDKGAVPLKDQLEAAAGAAVTREDMCDWVRSGRFDVAQVEMPSFDAFRQRLQAVLDEI